MAKRFDLTGEKYNKLTVIEYHSTVKGKARWLCRCECGKDTIVNYGNLVYGNVKSCGCIMQEYEHENLTGQIFGYLTVVEYLGHTKNNRMAKWKCICECGKETEAYAQNLKSGKTKSCGCYQQECRYNNHRTHGLTESPTYKTWQTMIQRCNNPKFTNYHNYGGRGIIVCNEWSDFNKFIEDMGVRPQGKTLNRIDNNKGYYKENCNWATIFEQSSNKRNNKYITHDGKTMTMSQWAILLRVNVSTISARIHKLGYTPEEAVSTPLKTNSKTQ